MKCNPMALLQGMYPLIKRLSCLYLAVLLVGCTKLEPVVVVVTATATQDSNINPPQVTNPTITPIPLPSTNSTAAELPATPAHETYIVQAGDTLSGIAAKFGLQIQTILRINNIEDPNILEVGQVINIPGEPTSTSPDFRIISDRRFIRGPNSQQFDVNTFISQQQGYIQSSTDIVENSILTAAQVVQRVSMEYSVDARLLLAILQFCSHWLTEKEIDEVLKQFPIQGKPSSDGIDRSGLYKQLSWTANQLNAGYYGWKYRGLNVLEFDDGTRVRFSSDINAGTIAVQYFLSLQNDYSSWESAVRETGLFSTYSSLFDNSLADDDQSLVPNQLQQPELEFPFASGQTWFFTGGPHGGWGSGSAWSAIDFAPPDDRPEGSALCYVSDYWATAMSSGVIARSSNGAVILDLDGDGDETTGWTILYLHMASNGRIEEGNHVQLGDKIGKPSCEGGFSNATHMHIARRYNGEWLPVSCSHCSTDKMPPALRISDWTVEGLDDQEYQGYMFKGSDRRNAEQGRTDPSNRVSW